MSTKIRTTINTAQEQTIELANSETFLNPANGRKIIAMDKVIVRNNKEKNMSSILIEKNGTALYFDTTPANLKSFGESICKLFEEPKEEAKQKPVEKKSKWPAKWSP